MTSSSLDPDNLPLGNDRILGRGHGAKALGPSDSSDSGSDLQGAPGLAQQVETDLVLGANDDIEADLDSDSDAGGTGERATAGRDSMAQDGADIDVDHIETIPAELADIERARPGHRTAGRVE